MAASDESTIGCGGLTGTNQGSAAIKRFWISPVARGLGGSKMIMSELE
ncbi:GNAT family N-acetyltransferase [Neomegalonema perideroedes]